MARAPEILAIRHQTLLRLTMKQRADSHRRTAAGVAAGLLLLVLPVAAWFAAKSTSAPPSHMLQASAGAGQTLQTARGQRLTFALADGSRVTLNTATRVRIAYSDQERRMTLEDGQAWFEVAKHQSRPFIVQAGGERIEAHGTAFDVRRVADRTEVMLAEGKVTVETDRPGRNRASVTMNPNDLVVASITGLTSRHVDNLDAWGNWRKGIVSFDDTKLGDAVAEMNRYSDTQIEVADAATGRIAVSGTFNAGATDAFVEALAIGFKVRASHPGEGRVVLKAAR